MTENVNPSWQPASAGGQPTDMSPQAGMETLGREMHRMALLMQAHLDVAEKMLTLINRMVAQAAELGGIELGGIDVPRIEVPHIEVQQHNHFHFIVQQHNLFEGPITNYGTLLGDCHPLAGSCPSGDSHPLGGPRQLGEGAPLPCAPGSSPREEGE